MASLSPRPDASSPDAVANASFSTARRGFDQQDVRAFLRQVAAELNRQQEQIRHLEHQLDAAAQAVPTELDDETVTRLLGEEATRILQTARESGSQIRSRAEEGAARLLREATEEAQRQREEADLEVARRRGDAIADAEAELSMAKQQGREMVEEARAYRERVLGELARRRDLARQQIEQLVHGRDRLLEAFERARMVALDVVAEISPLGAPDDYADLELPPASPVVIAPAVADPEAQAPEADELFDDEEVVVPPDPSGVTEEAPPDDTNDTPHSDDTDATADSHEMVGGDATVVPFPTPEPAPPETDLEDTEVADSEPADTAVGDLFARLRAHEPETEQEASEGYDTAGPVEEVDEGAAEVPETPFQQRDAVLVPLIVAGARKLKRVLADEQNEVLDTLRRREPVQTLDALVGGPTSQSDRYTEAIGAELVSAAEAGALSVDGTVPLDLGPTGTLAPVRESLASALVMPLRERLQRCVEDGDRDNEAVAKRARAVYREWKTQRIDEQLDDLFRLAHGRGACDSIVPGSTVRWIVDPAGPACPDAEDNSLAGSVTSGDPFPTGHQCAPAHAGCRCLLIPVDR